MYAVDTVPDYDLGTTATHSCMAGFALVGDQVRTCMAVNDPTDTVGVWSGTEPFCEGGKGRVVYYKIACIK